MSASAQPTRSYAGPVLLSYGFRPFFLLASIWAAVAMILWIAMLTGHLTVPSAFDTISWHVHALLYGYLPAVIAGFLLTAVPSWTGRPPVTGTPLLVLVLAWLVGRVAILCSAHLGPVVTALADLAFLALLSLVLAREILGGQNWRNLKVLALVALFFCGDALFHAEAAGGGAAYSGYGARLGLAAAILLIMVIGGRIVPAFTRNWLKGQGAGRLPTAFNRFDMAAMIVAGVALLLWLVAPDRHLTAALCLLAGLIHAARLTRWAGERTAAEPLVAILHIGYAFVPLGFLTVGVAELSPGAMPASAALHAWTAGAIGVMTLAVMTRASLGHLGKPLHATRGIIFIYVCAVAAALLRIAAGFVAAPQGLLDAAGIAWIAAFAGFALTFGPLLLRPRPAR